MQNKFATLPPLAMWIFAALLGVSALFDIARGLAAQRPLSVFLAVGPLAMAGFLAFCAWQRRAGRAALLASPGVTLAGYICFGAFVGAFVVKLFVNGPVLAA